MCMIFTVDEGCDVTQSELDYAYEMNSDSIGLAWADGRRTFCVKWLGDDYESFLEFRERFVVGAAHLIHFRYATVGDVTLDNAHPFRLADGVWMAHHGTLQGVSPAGNESDSQVLARMMAEFPDGWMDCPPFLDVLEGWLGFSRVAILDNSAGEPRFVILNAHKGVQVREGVWGANSSYLWSEEKEKGVEVISLDDLDESYYAEPYFIDDRKYARDYDMETWKRAFLNG